MFPCRSVERDQSGDPVVRRGGWAVRKRGRLLSMLSSAVTDQLVQFGDEFRRKTGGRRWWRCDLRGKGEERSRFQGLVSVWLELRCG